MIKVDEKDLSRVEMAFIAAATALVAFAPAAHADEQSDYLGCLTNHGLTITNRQQAAKDGSELISALTTGGLMPEGAPLYAEIHYHVDQQTAQIIGQCAQAAILMDGH